jgi:formylglycine-generating enzyme required for sulfatase activity
VVFLFSDCTAQRWYRADCLEELSQWARRAHLVVVNPLPQRFWTRTALEAAERINLIISQVASPNVAFRVSYPARPTADHALDRTLPLPVLAPDPRHLYAWTRFVALRRRTFPGRLFAGTRSHSTRRAGDQRRLDFRERLAMFKRQASPEAVELARLVAASPVINLPIVRFLRGHLLPRIRSGADPHDCSWDAEVMLSPLLRVAPRVHAVRPDDVLYCFHDEDLRASLLGELPRSRIEEVLEAIGFYVEHESLPLEAGRFHGFVAMLRNPEQAIGDEFYHVHEVVQVAARTIFRRLGGKYADLLKPQGQPRFLTELNTALRKAETARDGGDLAAALRVIDEAREAAAGENWRDARALLDETLRFYRGLLQVPELVRSAQAGRQPFVEPTTRMVLTPIAAGAFLMGSPDTEPERFPDEGPRHRVTLSHDFWMGIHPVTQEQYRAIMGTNPSQSKGKKRPVENVSWHDAVAFCDKLTEAARAAGVVPEGYVFRLPTEAEWEYCCRAGTETSTAFGDSLSSKQANFDGNVPYGNAEQGPYLQRTTDVGSYPPNAWGLFDMHGNVWEWCLDAAEGALVKTDTYVDGVVDPLCRVGRFRVYRGGSWIDVGRDCRSAFRIAVVPGGRYVRLGFRVCLARSPGGKRAVTETGEPVPSRAQPAGTASRSKSRRARTQPPP